MWFILSLTAILFWGTGDLFSKISSKPEDKFSHFKIVIAVGLVMGLHATASILTGAKFYPKDIIAYLPATVFYISSMTVGYFGLRYLMLSVCSPVCNSSGAVSCILLLIFLRQIPDIYSIVGIILVSVGIFLLGVIEKRTETKEINSGDTKYRTSFWAFLLPVAYCLLDGLGTFADAMLLDSGKLTEESANIAYEYTFAFCAVVAAVYVYGIKREKFRFKAEVPKLAVGVCETAGQMAYINVIGANPTVAAPMISSYCVLSVVLSRIFLKEKLSKKHYIVIAAVTAGIILMGVSEGLS